MKSLATGALCLAIGLGVGVVVAGSAPTTTFRVEKDQVRNGVRGAEMSRQEMAVIVREELARERVTHGANGVVQASAETVPHETIEEVRERMTQEQTRSADRAARIVADAVAHGAWTEQNKQDLRVALSDVPGPVQLEVFRSLGVAINSNRLRVETDGMPL